jgi:hypothetical protein
MIFHADLGSDFSFFMGNNKKKKEKKADFSVISTRNICPD